MRFMLRHLSLLLLLLPFSLRAEILEVPLALEQAFLQQLLSQQLFTGDAARPLRVWDDGHDCNHLELSDPVLTLEQGEVRTRSAARARIGTALAGHCVSVLDWQGFVEIVQVPALGVDPGTVQFRVRDSRVLAADGESAGAAGTVWDWVKRHAQPRFERLRVDINPLLDEIRALLPMVYPQQPEPIRRILQGVRLGGVAAETGKLLLQVNIDLPPGFSRVPDVGEQAPLTRGEMRRWEQSWQQWDAFITYFIKQAGQDAVTPEVRADLLAVLIEARRDLVPILSGSVDPETDPVPKLFVATWQRLEPVLRDLSGQLPQDSALRYLTFISAADALTAIEAVGAQTGFTLSADALRRLARLANPALAVDPLQYQTGVDPEMRAIFGFGPPIPRIPLSPPPAPAEDGEPLSLRGAFGGMLLGVLPTLVLNDQHYQSLLERLNDWVPTVAVLDEYLPLMQQLLDRIVGVTLNRKHLAGEYVGIFRPLVLATAWQESCWRQYVRRGGEVVTLRSPAGAVGIMQVNQYVWRGFYEIEGLLNDIGYNALAGAEILHHYLADYAIARIEHERGEGELDDLARATYAMYNGGPGQMSRFRQKNTPESLRAIDRAFWKKYQQVQENDPLAVAACYTG